MLPLNLLTCDSISSLAIIWFVTFFLYKRLVTVWKYRDFKGPSTFLSLPILGHSWMLQNHMTNALAEMRKKYGDIFVLDLGSYPTLIISDLDFIAEAWKMGQFNGRHFAKISTFTSSLGTDSEGNLPGFVFSDGKAWFQQRKFMTQSLNELRLKGTMEEILTEEAQSLCEILETLPKKTPISITEYFKPALNNAIWRLTTGKMTKQDNHILKSMSKHTTDFFDFVTPALLLTILQDYSFVITKISQWFGWRNMLDTTLAVGDIIRTEVKQGKPDLDGSYIDRFLALMEEAKEDPSSTFNKTDGEFHLEGQVFDMFFAGMESPNAVMQWLTLYMIAFPNIQEKMFQELDRVLVNRKPNLGDLKSCHYTMAVIQETYRFWPLVTTPHMVVEDIHFKGYHFPKGCNLSLDTRGVHWNPDNFPQPDQFRPERHLDEQGKFFCHSKMCIFGQGKRRCPGENLTKNELFLLVAFMFQTFKFKACSEEEEVDLELVHSLMVKPKPYQVVIERRY